MTDIGIWDLSRVAQLCWRFSRHQERLGIAQEELEDVAGQRDVCTTLLGLLPPPPGPRSEVVSCMNRWNISYTQSKEDLTRHRYVSVTDAVDTFCWVPITYWSSISKLISIRVAEPHQAPVNELSRYVSLIQKTKIKSNFKIFSVSDSGRETLCVSAVAPVSHFSSFRLHCWVKWKWLKTTSTLVACSCCSRAHTLQEIFQERIESDINANWDTSNSTKNTFMLLWRYMISHMWNACFHQM